MWEGLTCFCLSTSDITLRRVKCKQKQPEAFLYHQRCRKRGKERWQTTKFAQQKGQNREEKYQKQPQASERKAQVSGRKTMQSYKNKAPGPFGHVQIKGQGQARLTTYLGALPQGARHWVVFVYNKKAPGISVHASSLYWAGIFPQDGFPQQPYLNPEGKCSFFPAHNSSERLHPPHTLSPTIACPTRPTKISIFLAILKTKATVFSHISGHLSTPTDLTHENHFSDAGQLLCILTKELSRSPHCTQYL